MASTEQSLLVSGAQLIKFPWGRGGIAQAWGGEGEAPAPTRTAVRSEAGSRRSRAFVCTSLTTCPKTLKKLPMQGVSCDLLGGTSQWAPTTSTRTPQAPCPLQLPHGSSCPMGSPPLRLSPAVSTGAARPGQPQVPDRAAATTRKWQLSEILVWGQSLCLAMSPSLLSTEAAAQLCLGGDLGNLASCFAVRC